MTLIKSILLGSAAGIVAVASAQAADLPTKKAAPVEQYVKICNVGGITGWTLPGSDTCVKLSGYITAQFVGGNLTPSTTGHRTVNILAATSSVRAHGGSGGSTLAALIAPATTGASTPARADRRSPRCAGQRHLQSQRDRLDDPRRLRLRLRVEHRLRPVDRSLRIHGTPATASTRSATTRPTVNTGYLTWAGITAGKAASFYSFTGGGDNWANFFSPDQKGFNEPVLMAYTASFGGGFSATLAAQSPGTNGVGRRHATTAAAHRKLDGAIPGSITFGGQRWPDIVGALHVTQGWGEAQLSGVLHNVNV